MNRVAPRSQEQYASRNNQRLQRNRRCRQFEIDSRQRQKTDTDNAESETCEPMDEGGNGKNQGKQQKKIIWHELWPVVKQS